MCERMKEGRRERGEGRGERRGEGGSHPSAGLCESFGAAQKARDGTRQCCPQPRPAGQHNRPQAD